MRLLEKDIHDKQDTLISLRRQLEDVKKLNLELHNKLQVTFAAQMFCDDSVKLFGFDN